MFTLILKTNNNSKHYIFNSQTGDKANEKQINAILDAMQPDDWSIVDGWIKN